MTALELIDSIFSRPQRGPGDVRRLTPEQLGFLRDLIARDPEGARVKRGAPGSFVWSPPGAWQYALVEDLVGAKHQLVRTRKVTEQSGRLF